MFENSISKTAEHSVYLTAADVAHLLRISLRTLHSHVKHRRVPSPIWLGGKRLWAAQVIHDFLGAARNHKRR
ncbi:helix-turn-helix domain-containing protein [Polaromonas sp. C04]|uniref:helix-turn-helix transcriptional regulator n=1 Tax=Polaromonas sp. C04 TaxID=1945857 RepID=UPI0009868D5B|nr:helix-turn-helix domain-containing protein [Polaromonas sp. C04]OOG53138.1 hypothetical protein B0E49_11715 [Polaromonas sp. C04]